MEAVRRLLASCVASTDPIGGGFHPPPFLLAGLERRQGSQGQGDWAFWQNGHKSPARGEARVLALGCMLPAEAASRFVFALGLTP